MASRFNRFLRGFLGALDAKVGGVTPGSFMDEIRTTIGAEPFMFAQARELVWGTTGNLGAATEGFNPITGTLLTVPEDEIWFCHYGSVGPQLNVAVGDTYRVSPAVEIDATGTGQPRHIILGESSAAYDIGAAYRPQSQLSRLYIALPSDQFGVWVHQAIGGGAVDFLLSLLILRARV